MTDATFPGNGNYFARLEAWRVGFTIYGRLTIFKTGGSGYWVADPQAYGAHAAGVSYDGAYTYDFRNYSSLVVREWSTTVSAPGTYTVAAWADMAGFGRAQPAAIAVTVPPNSPAAPGTPTVDYVNDKNISVTWRRNATAVAPYASQQVQRRTFAGSWSGYVGVASYGNNTTTGNQSWSDTSTVANRLYLYRVKAANGSGETYSGDSRWVFTTPAAPTAFTAAKRASGSIDLAFTRGTPHTEIKTKIEYSTNGGTSWTALTELSKAASTYTMATPPTGSSIVFRARHTIDSSAAAGHGLQSSWAQSNSVGLTAPPYPPSNLAPNGVVLDGLEPFTATWQFNSADSSDQRRYQIRFREAGGAWTEEGVYDTSSPHHAFPGDLFANGADYEWAVRTWGAHADPSPWSASAVFTASTVPMVTITSPAAVHNVAMVTAEWAYTDPEGTAQSAWEAELLHAGSVIERRTGAGAASSAPFSTRLQDATEYQLRVRVRDGSLLWSNWDQRTFETDFPLPEVPTLDAGWNNDTGKVALTVENPSTGPEVVQNQLQRSLDGGASWTDVGIAPPNGTGFDPTAPLNQEILYRAVAWSELPSTSVSASKLVVTATSQGFWSAGAAFETGLVIGQNLGSKPYLGLEYGRAQRVLNYYAGRTLPVESQGMGVHRSGTMGFAIEADDLALVREMALLPAPHLVRMPDGTTVFASVGTVKESRAFEGWYQITVPITEVDR